MDKSRLLTFIDKQGHFTINFFFGLPLISELKRIHNFDEIAEKFYKEVLLSSVHMLTFLKPGENLGFYIDSEKPYFRFKLEMSNTGHLRTLLLPEAFDSFPDKITGLARTTKIMPNSNPYNSTIKIEDQNNDQIMNQVLTESYQTKSSIELGRELESIMITRLPKATIDSKFDLEDERTLLDFTLEESSFINNAFAISQQQDEQELIKYFEENGFNYLSGRDVQFHCPCSKERMISNLFSLHKEDRDDLFSAEDSISTRCDYCNSNYEIFKSDMLN